MELIKAMQECREVFWFNSDCGTPMPGGSRFAAGDIDAAADRLQRFAPLIMHFFPETAAAGGVIESPLTEIEATRRGLQQLRSCNIPGRVFLKRDSDLPVSGSVKARGGIYEVLKHTEDLASAAGLMRDTSDDILKLASSEARACFAAHKIQVGSTGNLGMSIGIMSAALGYETIVHMSADAKQWKKDLLRSRGATVREYEGDYGEAVRAGRALSDADPSSYFVDDENSRELFCGYAVAGRRLAAQLDRQGIRVDGSHPLMVYIPCGVGGAPGGITFGLKQIFGDHVHVFFVEPVQAPCMLLGLATGKRGGICVQDIGLTGTTQADGLAVGRCSELVAREMTGLLSGEFTVRDERLVPYLRTLYENDRIFIEPSACAAFEGAVRSMKAMRAAGIEALAENVTHIVWATGGSMVPDPIRAELLGN